MVHTHIWMTQLNIKKQERDFKTENQQLEADKEKRVTKKNLKKLLKIRTKLLIEPLSKTKNCKKKILFSQVKTKFLNNKSNISKIHLQIQV